MHLIIVTYLSYWILRENKKATTGSENQIAPQETLEAAVRSMMNVTVII